MSPVGSFAAATLGALAGSAVTVAALYAARRAGRLWFLDVRATPCPAPNPGWVPPKKQKAAPAETPERFQTLDPKELGPGGCYPLVISSVVPRPIAFVSTVNSEGAPNLSPYSYFGAVAHDPPCIAIGICRSGARGGGKKDTLVNIEATGEFCVNIISEWFINAANHTCGNFEPEEDEFELSGLTPLRSDKVCAPRVAESAFHMECKLKHKYELENDKGVPTTTIVIGEVVLFHAHESATGKSPSGKTVMDIQKYQPIGRLGGNTYARTTSIFDMPRPDRSGRVL